MLQMLGEIKGKPCVVKKSLKHWTKKMLDGPGQLLPVITFAL